MAKPVDFEESTHTLAGDQPQYLHMPVWKEENGDETISCWRLSWIERIQVLVWGKVWLRILTFGNPLQPQFIETSNPFRDLFWWFNQQIGCLRLAWNLRKLK